MISHKHKFIFIHIPKTGGSSIEKSLDKNVPHVGKKNPSYHLQNTLPQNKHYNTREYIDALDKKIFDEYFKFSFVRNPWSIEVSRFEWMKLHGHKFSFKKYIHQETCKSFLNYWLDLDCTNFIGRFENLQEDFNIICKKIGIQPQKLSHINKNAHKHYAEYYDNETREIVAEKYARDIEYFGYKFEA